MDKPKVLYRGIVLLYSKAIKGGYLDGPLFTTTEAKMDKNGRPVVRDGNEYGLYMTDNISVAQDAYGNPTQFEQVNKYQRDNGYRMSAPSVGIVYEIDTSNIEIKNPNLYAPFQNNNGFGGNEWITKSSVNETDYRAIRIKISEDVFNKPEIIETDGCSKEDIYSKVNTILTNRRRGLDVAAQLLDRLPLQTRNTLSLMNGYFKALTPYLNANGKFFAGQQAKEDTTDELEIVKDKLINHYIKRALNDPSFNVRIIAFVDKVFSSKDKDLDSIVETLNFQLSRESKPEAQEIINLLLDDLDKLKETKVEV